MRELWPVVEKALDFVLRWQDPDGSVRWSLDPAGRPEGYALLTGSSSIYHSLRCGVAAAEALGKDRPDWELAAGRLGHAVAHHPGAFAPKDEFAMDWYYPMLSGALEGEPGRRRIDEGWSTFVMEGLGVRCVSTSSWVTAAETAECVLALDALGLDADARRLFTAAQGLRLADGSYWTGMVYPERETFPGAERTTYTAAAIILAADALSNASPAAGLFRGESLPVGLDLAESRRCPGGGRRPAAPPGSERTAVSAGSAGRGHPAQHPQAPALAVFDPLARRHGRRTTARRGGGRRRPGRGTRRGWPASRPRPRGASTR